MSKDLISREYVKKAIADLVVGGEEHIKEVGEGNSWVNGIHSAYREIDNAPTVELQMGRMTNGIIIPIKRPTGEWIPVSEKMPEETFNPNTQDFGEILCTTIWNDVRLFKFGQPIGSDRAHFWDYGQIVDEFVIAWMPLPEPYKKGDR